MNKINYSAYFAIIKFECKFKGLKLIYGWIYVVHGYPQVRYNAMKHFKSKLNIVLILILPLITWLLLKDQFIRWYFVVLLIMGYLTIIYFRFLDEFSIVTNKIEIIRLKFSYSSLVLNIIQATFFFLLGYFIFVDTLKSFSYVVATLQLISGVVLGDRFIGIAQNKFIFHLSYSYVIKKTKFLDIEIQNNFLIIHKVNGKQQKLKINSDLEIIKQNLGKIKQSA
jgi:hypothetical protein